MELEKNVKQIISDILGITPDLIKADTEMRNTPEWDSLRHMQLVVAIEQNYGIGPLSAENIVAMTRFANILRILEKSLGRISKTTDREQRHGIS